MDCGNVFESLLIGSRPSVLALWQARKVQSLLKESFPNDPFIQQSQIIPIKSTGDKIQDKPLHDIGGKALFAKELQQALLNKKIHMAVHSLKDLEVTSPDYLSLKAVLKRDDHRDILITRLPDVKSLNDLPNGFTLGSCSPRREALTHHYKRNINFSPLRGNIDSRLKKIQEKEIEGTILSLCGLQRLELLSLNYNGIKGYPDLYGVPLGDYISSPGQGVIAVEGHDDNDNVLSPYYQALNHKETMDCIQIEKNLQRELEANCRTALGAFAQYKGNDHYTLNACYSHEGQPLRFASVEGDQTLYKKAANLLADDSPYGT